MNHIISPEIRQLMEVVNYRPAVSLIMPMEVKMGLKNEMVQSLKIAAGKIERALYADYPAQIVSVVMEKLRDCIGKINFNTGKKSIAIYVSPVFEKVLYLEIPVEEKIIIDESFEIRDLVYCTKELRQYLVLLLSSAGSRLFIGNTDSLIKIIADSQESIVPNEKDNPERVANFSDASQHKEILMDKFLLHVDRTLDEILRVHPLPLFVLAAERVAGHFKAITRNSAAVMEYLHGNYEEATLPELKALLEPYFTSLKKGKEKILLNQLEDAAGNRKLSTGIEDAWRAAINKNGRLLVVEKNYMYPAEHGNTGDIIYAASEMGNRFSHIKDAVDDVIERVLENGGDVAFTDEDVLKDYGRIALIQYY